MDKKLKLDLSCCSGNVFVIIAKARKTARQAGWGTPLIDRMVEEAQSGDYDNALLTMHRYFDVVV